MPVNEASCSSDVYGPITHTLSHPNRVCSASTRRVPGPFSEVAAIDRLTGPCWPQPARTPASASSVRRVRIQNPLAPLGGSIEFYPAWRTDGPPGHPQQRFASHVRSPLDGLSKAVLY